MPFRSVAACLVCALSAVLTVGCFAPKLPAPAPAPVHAVRPQAPAPQVVPLKRGEIPHGWRYSGLAGPVIQFVNVENDAAVNFYVFSSQNWTAESVIRRLADQGASKPGVTISGIFVVKDGCEAGLNIRDNRIGTKLGRAVARTFPDRSSLGIMVVGLWPADRDDESTRDFDKFLEWVRLE